MKLLFCPECDDVQKLRMEPEITTCECGKSWGFYKPDGWTAVIGKGLAIGIDNNALAYAKKQRIEEESPGSVWLSAWLMAADHDTIEYNSKRDMPVGAGREET